MPFLLSSPAPHPPPSPLGPQSPAKDDAAAVWWSGSPRPTTNDARNSDLEAFWAGEELGRAVAEVTGGWQGGDWGVVIGQEKSTASSHRQTPRVVSRVLMNNASQITAGEHQATHHTHPDPHPPPSQQPHMPPYTCPSASPPPPLPSTSLTLPPLSPPPHPQQASRCVVL